MSDPTGLVHVVFNGEIYNFRELRDELKRGGCVFRTTSDTEVILHLYLRDGPDMVRRLLGMFAIAIWDERSTRLYLFRDRIGVKPLYYYSNGDTFLFASEIKGMAAMPAFQRQLNLDALIQFFRYGFISGEHTIFTRTFKVPPGCYLEVSSPRRIRRGRYWSAHDYKPEPSFDQSRLEDLLETSISYRMIADVPVGLFLSGGIDSSLIAAVLTRKLGLPIQTYTVGFDDAACDESHHARKIAEYLGTVHHEFHVGEEDALALMSDIGQAFDEPFADSSAIPTYILSRLTREKTKVVLSGEGGDELFCGYPRYPLTCQQSPAALRKAYRSMMRFFTDEEIGVLIPDAHLEPEPEHYEDAGDPIYLMTQDDLTHYLPDDLLVKVDRTSMAASLEVREPLLDHRLVEFALRMPSAVKLQNGQTKHVLKELLARYIPRELFERPKQGFMIPYAKWLNGRLRPHVVEAVHHLAKWEVLDGAQIRSYLSTQSHRHLLWALTALSQWKRRWME